MHDRRVRADMLLVYKIINGISDIKMDKLFTINSSKVTRGHKLQLNVPKCSNSEIRRNFFSQRAIVPWNKLPEKVVESVTIESFKREYDKYMLRPKNTL